MPWKVLLAIFVAVVVVGGIAVGIYFGIHRRKGIVKPIKNAVDTQTHPNAAFDTSVPKYANGTLTVRGDPREIDDGFLVRLVYDGTWNGQPVKYSYSVGNQAPVEIRTAPLNEVAWSVPPNLFGNVVFSAVGPGSADDVKSKPYSVVPDWTMLGPGERQNSVVQRGTTAYFTIHSNDTAVFAVANMKVTVDGKTVPTTPGRMELAWTPDAALADKPVVVSSTTLVANGFPSEIAYTMPFTVTVVEPPTVPSEGLSAAVVATTDSLDSAGFSGDFHPGDDVIVCWQGHAIVAAKVTAAGARVLAGPLRGLKSQQIPVHIPDDVDLGDLVITLEDDTDPQVRADVTLKITEGGAWSIGPQGSTVFKVVSEGSRYSIDVAIQVADVTRATATRFWADTSNWEMIYADAGVAENLADVPAAARVRLRDYGALSVDLWEERLIFTGVDRAIPFITSSLVDQAIRIWVAHKPASDADYRAYPSTFLLTKHSSAVAPDVIPTLDTQVGYNSSTDGGLVWSSVFPGAFACGQTLLLHLTGKQMSTSMFTAFLDDIAVSAPTLPTSDDEVSLVVHVPNVIANETQFRIQCHTQGVASVISPPFSVVPALRFATSAAEGAQNIAYDEPLSLQLLGSTWIFGNDNLLDTSLERSFDEGASWVRISAANFGIVKDQLTWTPGADEFNANPKFRLRLSLTLAGFSSPVTSAMSEDSFLVSRLPTENVISVLTGAHDASYVTADTTDDGEAIIALLPGSKVTLTYTGNQPVTQGTYEVYLYAPNATGTTHYQVQYMDLSVTANQTQFVVTLPTTLPDLGTTHVRFGLRQIAAPHTVLLSAPFTLGPAYWLTIDDWNAQCTEQERFHLHYTLHCPLIADMNTFKFKVGNEPTELFINKSPRLTGAYSAPNVISGCIFFDQAASPFRSFTSGTGVGITVSCSSIPTKAFTDGKLHNPVREWRLPSPLDTPQNLARWEMMRRLVPTLADAASRQVLAQYLVGPHMAAFASVYTPDKNESTKTLPLIDGAHPMGTTVQRWGQTRVDLGGAYSHLMWGPGAALDTPFVCTVEFYPSDSAKPVETEKFWFIPNESTLGANRIKYGDMLVVSADPQLTGVVDPDNPKAENTERGPFTTLLIQDQWVHRWHFVAAKDVTPVSFTGARSISSWKSPGVAWGTPGDPLLPSAGAWKDFDDSTQPPTAIPKARICTYDDRKSLCYIAEFIETYGEGEYSNRATFVNSDGQYSTHGSVVNQPVYYNEGMIWLEDGKYLWWAPDDSIIWSTRVPQAFNPNDADGMWNFQSDGHIVNVGSQRRLTIAYERGHFERNMVFPDSAGSLFGMRNW